MNLASGAAKAILPNVELNYLCYTRTWVNREFDQPMN